MSRATDDEPHRTFFSRVLRRPDVGFTVRMAWSDGTHDFYGFARTQDRAQHLQARYERAFGPVQCNVAGFHLTKTVVVKMLLADWELHQQLTARWRCRSTQCPSPDNASLGVLG